MRQANCIALSEQGIILYLLPHGEADEKSNTKQKHPKASGKHVQSPRTKRTKKKVAYSTHRQSKHKLQGRPVKVKLRKWKREDTKGETDISNIFSLPRESAKVDVLLSFRPRNFPSFGAFAPTNTVLRRKRFKPPLPPLPGNLPEGRYNSTHTEKMRNRSKVEERTRRNTNANNGGKHPKRWKKSENSKKQSAKGQQPSHR